MSVALEGKVKELYIPELGKTYAAPSEVQMLDMCDNVIEGLCATGQRFTRIASLNDGALSWVEYIAGRLRSAKVLNDSEETGGVGKIAPVSLRHYRGEEGGRLPDVDFFPEYSAGRSVFVNHRVAGIDKVNETGQTEVKFNSVMADFEVRSFVFATLVSKIPPEKGGPAIFGHLASSPDVWYIFPPQRPKMIRNLAERLAAAKEVNEKLIMGYLVKLFAPQTNEEYRRLIRFLPRNVHPGQPELEFGSGNGKVRNRSD